MSKGFDQVNQEQFRDRLILLAIGAFLFFGNLGAAPLWDRDEPRNAGCTAEMLAANDLVVPVFNDELRTHKPIMLYWLMMVSYAVFGVSELGARAVSAFAGLGTVLLTYEIGRRLFDRGAAFWSAVALASAVMFGVATRAATPDGLLIFCGTLAIFFFIRGTRRAGDFNSGGMPRGFDLYAMYAAMGLGVLVKGPVGLFLPTAVLGMYLLLATLPPGMQGGSRYQARFAWLRPFLPMHFLRTCWHMRPITAILIAGAISIPWYLWVHLRTNGVWTHEFFWLHNVGRASDAMEGHTGPPVLFYVGSVLAGFFPWSILTVPAAIHLFRHPPETRYRRPLQFLACWVGVYIALFSLAQTKLPSYVTPCYPAFALLLGFFASRWDWNPESLQSLPVGWLKVGLAHWLVIGLAMLVGLPWAANRWLPGSEWVGLIGVILILGGAVCWRYLVRGQFSSTRNSLALTGFAFTGALMLFLPAEVGRHRNDQGLFAVIQHHPGPIISFGHLEPSWIFYGKKPIREFPSSDTEELQSYLDSHPDVLLVTTDRRLDSLAAKIPRVRQFGILQRSAYFLRDRELILLADRDVESQVAKRAQEKGSLR